MNNEPTDSRSNDRVGWSIPEWGARYGYSRAFSYRIAKSPHGPRVTNVPGTTKNIVTIEADAEYRAQLNELQQAEEA